LTEQRLKLELNPDFAGVAQLVERQLPKLNVESSNLFARFRPTLRPSMNREPSLLAGKRLAVDFSRRETNPPFSQFD
jgi:hypothetical protein